MIESAKFVLLLRCDGDNEKHGEMNLSSAIRYRQCGDGFSAENEFTGETRAHAIRAARGDGWLVGSSRTVANRAYCPECHHLAPKNWRRAMGKR